MGKASRYRCKAKSKARHFNFDEKTSGYYLRIEETLKDDFQNEESKDLFIRNVIQQLSDEALEVCQNPMICPIAEKLFNLAQENELETILTTFSRDWEKACCSKTVSFATQALLRCCNKFLVSSTSILLKPIQSLLSFLLESLALFMQHTSASHIIRVIMQVLSGINADLNHSRKPLINDSKKEVMLLSATSSESQKLLEKLCIQVVNLPKLDDHIQNYLSCPVLQTVLICSKVLAEETVDLIHLAVLKEGKLLEKIDQITKLPSNSLMPYSSHLVEVLLISANDNLYRRIWKSYFKEHLFEMAKHPTANFVLQRLLSTCRNIKQFNSMFKELSNKVEDILGFNHPKVIIELCSSCVKFNSKQPHILKHLLKAFHCFEPASLQIHLFKLLVTMTTFERFYSCDVSSEKETHSLDSQSNKGEINSKLSETNYYGSLLVQILAQFSNNALIISGMLDLSVEEFLSLCQDMHGCHVIEEVLISSTVGEKNKHKLCNKLKGKYISLACNKYGSRVFESIWRHSGLKLKKEIAEELSSSGDKLKSDKFGFFIHSSCAIDTFKKRPHQWSSNQNLTIKKQKLFQNIIGKDLETEDT